jgi:phytanoyl-CoA hydroxylase
MSKPQSIALPSSPITMEELRLGKITADAMRERFTTDGYLHFRGMVRKTELDALNSETWALIEQARQMTPARPLGMDDFAYESFVSAFAKQPLHAPATMLQDIYFALHRRSSTMMPRAIDHIGHYSLTARALLGHPDLLSIVEAMQGSQFITTASPMVLKYPGKGAMMPWHRDALRPKDAPEGIPTFTADIYLDATTADTSVWIVPGSHRWSVDAAQAECSRRNDEHKFNVDDAVPIIVEPGDLLLHHTWLIHGSDDSSTNLRRVIYFQFLPMDFASGMFNHTYIRHSHRRIAMSIAERQGMSHITDESPYHYRTNVSFADQADPDWRSLLPFRVPFWFYRRDT